MPPHRRLSHTKIAPDPAPLGQENSGSRDFFIFVHIWSAAQRPQNTTFGEENLILRPNILELS